MARGALEVSSKLLVSTPGPIPSVIKISTELYSFNSYSKRSSVWHGEGGVVLERRKSTPSSPPFTDDLFTRCIHANFVNCYRVVFGKLKDSRVA